MSQSTLMKCKGLYSFPNHLSAAPQGALLTAKNIIINRDEIAESRRGFKIYGNAMGSSSTTTAHQLMSYKGRLLRHYGATSGTTLEYDSDSSGTFAGFNLILTGNTHTNTTIDGLPSTSQLQVGMFVSGSNVTSGTTIVSIIDNASITISVATSSSAAISLTFTMNIAEVTQGLRIKSIEQNGNLYFTASTGIKKISSDTASGLSTALITNAGGIKALDFTATASTGPGFFTSSNNIATTGTTNNGSMTGTIVINTVSSPTVITSTAHKLFTNDLITITGSNSTPLIDGTFPIVVIDANTFTIPVDVTVAGNAGTWTFTGHSNIIYNIPDTSTLTIGYTIIGTASGTITNATVANPTHVTSTAHGLLSGDTIIITGSDSTPTINGSRVVTVIDVDHFTIPVNVTVQATTGAWTSNVYPAATTITQIIDGTTIKVSNSGIVSRPNVTLSSATNSVVAYRVVWGITDINKNEILGTPSSRTIVHNTDVSNSKNVSLVITIPKGVTTAHFYQIYRTPVVNDPFSNQDPGDEEQLVNEGNPLQSDLTNGYVTVIDKTPETFRAGGANLYTNQNSGEGILQANDLPPLAKDITSFKGYTFYSNTQTLQRLNLALLSVVNLVADTSSITITDGVTTNTYTFAAAENIATKKVLISTLPTPGQEVDETARSLVRVINRNASEIVYAYYLSGPSDVPGLILFEARNISQAKFHVICNDAATTGVEFNPKLLTSGTSVISDNEIQPHRLYYSKFQQPEAVPILNFLDVGPQDKSILRVLALRDNLFILKEDGVYRLSGQTSSQFTVYPFDFSVNLKAPDSAVVLNNLIYLYSSQGISTISDTGIAVISRPIEDAIAKFVIPAYSNFTTSTFGLAYESDRTYYLFTVTNTSDTHATQCLRYNTFTQTWTQSDLSKRCGVINPSDDQMYLGANDTNFIEQERKSFDRTDFTDREKIIQLSTGGVNDTVISLPSVSGITAGDVLTQVQYLTISKFNQLLSKLDRDSRLSPHNYVSTLLATPGMNLSTQLDSLITAISTDAGRVASGGTAAGTYTALLPTGASFSAQQTNFNLLIDLLNSDVGVGYKNYTHSTSTVSFELNILSVNSINNTITAAYTYPLITGPTTIYSHIDVQIEWTPQFFQDVSMTKHVSEGTLIFEDSSFTTAILSYATDLSANLEDQSINGNGNGIFGNNVYGNGLYGGNGSGVPFRTLIPKEKQRCRYINVKFEHSISRESFALYGLSLTWQPISQRGWR